MMRATHCWQDESGAWFIGSVANITTTCVTDQLYWQGEFTLVRHHYSGELEFVETSRLRPYPQEPIEEPPQC